MTMIMDIMQDYLEWKGYNFLRHIDSDWDEVEMKNEK